MDSPTSWIVAAGCCSIHIFSCVLFRASGVVYLAILNSLHTSRAEAAWPITVMNVLSCAAGPVMGWLATRIAVWKMSVFACLVAALSVSASYFANGIWFLIVSIGVVHGISSTFIALCYTVIRVHFTRYRTLACGISDAGLAISGMVFPPLLQFLLEKYGPKGMFLVTGALMLNATAGALLQRLPPETPRKSVSILHEEKKRETSFDKSLSAKFKNGLGEYTADGEGPALSPEDGGFLTQDDSSHEYETTRGVCERLEVQTVPLSNTKTTKDEGSWQRTEPGVEVCVRPAQANADEGDVDEKVLTYYITGNTNQRRVTLPTYLRLPKFYVIALANAVVNFNLTTYSTVILDFATDRKVPQWNAIFLPTFYSTAGLVARLASGWITDKGTFKKSSMMAGNLFLLSLSLCLMPFCYSFQLHVIQAAVIGWCGGTTYTLAPVLLMELVDTKQFSECFGVSSLIAGIPLLLRPLLIGYFRDSLREYQGLFVLMGVVTAFTAFNCLLLRSNLEKKMHLLCFEKRSINGNGKRATKLVPNHT